MFQSIIVAEQAILHGRCWPKPTIFYWLLLSWKRLDGLLCTSEGIWIFHLKFTLLAGQQLISNEETKFGDFCLAIFAVGWQKMNNNNNH